MSDLRVLSKAAKTENCRFTFTNLPPGLGDLYHLIVISKSIKQLNPTVQIRIKVDKRELVENEVYFMHNPYAKIIFDDSEVEGDKLEVTKEIHTCYFQKVNLYEHFLTVFNGKYEPYTYCREETVVKTKSVLSETGVGKYLVFCFKASKDLRTIREDIVEEFINANHDIKIVTLGGGQINRVFGNLLNLCNKTTVEETVAYLRFAHLVLTVDSLPLHLARGEKKKIVCLFRHLPINCHPQDDVIAFIDKRYKQTNRTVDNRIDVKPDILTKLVRKFYD